MIPANLPHRVLIVQDVTVFGGHLVQATQTAAGLRRLGIDVTVATEPNVPVEKFDVLHSFGASRATLRRARAAGAVLAATPIWWEYGHTQSRVGRVAAGATRTSRIALSVVRRGIDDTARRLRRQLEETAMTLELADVLLPNSQGEAARLKEELALSVPMQVVPNGVDPQLFTPPADDRRRTGILCVSRLEPHKNQLDLVRELRGSGIPLTIVGDEHPHHPGYAARCRKAADDNVAFLPSVAHDELVHVYRRAAVHVLPSWFETTGLVSLEAAATGCAIVTTERGYTREYFGDLAHYCHPGRRGSIRAAVKTAISGPVRPELRRRVLENFTWDHAARATAAAYAGVRHRPS